MNRLETVEVDGVIEQEYSYDSLSRLELAKDYNGSRKTNVVEYEYDNLNNISKSTQNGKVVDSVYNLNSKLESIAAQSYKVVNTYTTRDSLDKITLNENEIVDFDYDKDNRLVKTKLSNGITQDVNYDDRSREEKREYTRNGQIVYSQTTQYDSNSNVVREDIVEQNTNIIKEYWSGNLNSDT